MHSLLLLTVCRLLALPFDVIAQENINFPDISQQDGLASDNILAMLRDDQGFMWIGTENGLNRFDGQHFLRFGFDPVINGLTGRCCYSVIDGICSKLF